VAVRRITEANLRKVSEVDLLFVGSPTHLHGLSTPSSRRQALQPVMKELAALEPGAEGPGAREWLDQLPKVPPGRRAVAFDTRLSSPWAGGAARPIARRLRRHGYQIASKPEGFIVEGANGPLRTGEPERARAWAAGLVRSLSSPTVGSTR
jgi:hypothetical protein